MTEVFIKAIGSFSQAGLQLKKEPTEHKEDTLAVNKINLKFKCRIGC